MFNPVFCTALQLHFGSTGKNDKRIFAAELLKLDPAGQQIIIDFVTGLEEWRQLKFISFVAEMIEHSDRQLFLKKLIATKPDDEKLKFLNALCAFSSDNILTAVLAKKAEDVAKKLDEANRKAIAWLQKLEQNTRRR